MYTVQETYEEIATFDSPILCDKTFYNIDGEIRVLDWQEIAERKSGPDGPMCCVRSWSNGVWHDTSFHFNPANALDAVKSFEYGV